MRLENDEGLPWTAATGIGWIVLIVVLTLGVGCVLLSMYLALWIRGKGRSSLPLIGFLLSASCILPDISWLHLHVSSNVADGLAAIDTVLWIASIFYLRHEIVAYYRESEGWNIGIGPWLTFFFSSIYINYCLNPVTIYGGRNTITSLNLSSSVDSAKITK
jgi:hypothetical protein